MLTNKLGVTVAVLAVAFSVTFAAVSVVGVAGPVAPAFAADDEADGPLDEDDCEDLQRVYNEAAQVASDERAAGNWTGWDLFQSYAQEAYLEAEFGGCEWAAEAAPVTRRFGSLYLRAVRAAAVTDGALTLTP